MYSRPHLTTSKHSMVELVFGLLIQRATMPSVRCCVEMFNESREFSGSVMHRLRWMNTMAGRAHCVAQWTVARQCVQRAKHYLLG